MELETAEMDVQNWTWSEQMSKSGKMMLKCTYVGTSLSDPVLNEYLCLRHDGYARSKSATELKGIAKRLDVELDPDADLHVLAAILNQYYPPVKMAYKKDGAFWRILDKQWSEAFLLIPPIDDDDDIPF